MMHFISNSLTVLLLIGLYIYLQLHPTVASNSLDFKHIYLQFTPATPCELKLQILVTNRASCILYHCPMSSKRTAHIALVHSILEYGAIVCNSYYCGDVERLEQIQHHATRFIKGDYHSRHQGCVSIMLTD